MFKKKDRNLIYFLGLLKLTKFPIIDYTLNQKGEFRNQFLY